MKTDKAPSMHPEWIKQPHLLGLAQMCRHVRFGILKQAKLSVAEHRMVREGVVIHCQLTQHEFDDLRQSTEATFQSKIQAFVAVMPCLIVDISAERYNYRWTIPLWQPLLAEWLQANHAHAPELLVSCDGQALMSLFVTLSPASGQLLLSEHRRTVREDDRYSTECAMRSGINAMVNAEVHHGTLKPLCHFIVSSPEIEAILFDVYRSAASQVEQALDVSVPPMVH